MAKNFRCGVHVLIIDMREYALFIMSTNMPSRAFTMSSELDTSFCSEISLVLIMVERIGIVLPSRPVPLGCHEQIP